MSQMSLMRNYCAVSTTKVACITPVIYQEVQVPYLMCVLLSKVHTTFREYSFILAETDHKRLNPNLGFEEQSLSGSTDRGHISGY